MIPFWDLKVELRLLLSISSKRAREALGIGCTNASPVVLVLIIFECGLR